MAVSEDTYSRLRNLRFKKDLEILFLVKGKEFNDEDFIEYTSIH